MLTISIFKFLNDSQLKCIQINLLLTYLLSHVHFKLHLRIQRKYD
jgi:hypothetical protein